MEVQVIVGTIIVKNNCILMVKEAKEKCYGKWNFPSGHLELNETIIEGAKRETREETGCEVEITKAFPIINLIKEDKNFIILFFLAELQKECNDFRNEEILETKFIPIEEIKKMNNEEIRNILNRDTVIKALENGNLYPLEIIKDLKEF